MDYAIPGEAGVVDDDVDLAPAKLCSALDELGDVVAIQDVADHGEGSACLGGVDGICDRVGFVCVMY